MIKYIGFDADDTLWHNEILFTVTQNKFKQLLGRYHSPEWINQRLYETEVKNIRHFGYGVKGFTLSMVETAIELSEGRITAFEIQQLIDAAKDMLKSPVQLMDGVEEVISSLAKDFQLILITKGDLFDQQSKLTRSGLENYFSKIEIVSEKDEPTYKGILERNRIEPNHFLMIGNSVKSDILPVIAVGSQAIHIPYTTTWIHERVDESDESRYIKISKITELPDVIYNLY